VCAVDKYGVCTSRQTPQLFNWWSNP